MVPWSNTARRVMPWPNAGNRPNTSWRRFSVATVRHPTAWGRQAPQWHCSLVSDSAAVLNCMLSTLDLCWMRNACALASQCGTCLTPRAYTCERAVGRRHAVWRSRSPGYQAATPHIQAWVVGVPCDVRYMRTSLYIAHVGLVCTRPRGSSPKPVAGQRGRLLECDDRCPSPATPGRKSFLSPGGGMCK